MVRPGFKPTTSRSESGRLLSYRDGTKCRSICMIQTFFVHSEGTLINNKTTLVRIIPKGQRCSESSQNTQNLIKRLSHTCDRCRTKLAFRPRIKLVCVFVCDRGWFSTEPLPWCAAKRTHKTNADRYQN